MSTNVIRIAESRAVYTVAEVSQLLSLSRGNTYAMVRTGEIPSKKIGSRWVIPKVRFHAWLNDLPEASAEEVEKEIRAWERRRGQVAGLAATGSEGK